MKRLKKISLEDFDRLSSAEASRLIGGKDDGKHGYGYGTIPPPKPTTYKPSLPGPYGSVVPGGYSGGYNSGNIDIREFGIRKYL